MDVTKYQSCKEMKLAVKGLYEKVEYLITAQRNCCSHVPSGVVHTYVFM